MATQAQNAWIERVLGTKLGAPAEAAAASLDVQAEKSQLADLGLDLDDIWQSAADAFRAATEAVDHQIAALQARLRETDDVDLHDIADSGLNGLTDGTRVPLMAAIKDAGKGGEKLKAAAPRLRATVQAFRRRLASDDIRACDAGTFDVPVSIAATYARALDQLDYAAGLAA